MGIFRGGGVETTRMGLGEKLVTGRKFAFE